MELFVSQGLIQAFFGLFDGHRLICYNIPYFSWKTSTWSKANKDGKSSPHNCCIAVFRQTISTVWLCKETSNNKHDRITVKYLNVLHHNRTQKQLRHSFLTFCKNVTNSLFLVLLRYLATCIKNNNLNLYKLWCWSECKK